MAPITARYKLGSEYILLDFSKPILTGNIPGFYVNDQPVTTEPGPTTDSLWLSVIPFNQSLDDVWLEYRPVVTSPLLYLIGAPLDRVVTAFKKLVTIERLDSGVFNSTNTSFLPILGDFIDAYGLQEAITISNPDNALAESPDEYKFIRAFEDANALYEQYLLAIDFANRSAITAGRRRTVLIFARYFLDSRCRRKNVTEDFERAVEDLTRINLTDNTSIEPGLYINEDFVVYGSSTCHPCNDICLC